MTFCINDSERLGRYAYNDDLYLPIHGGTSKSKNYRFKNVAVL